MMLGLFDYDTIYEHIWTCQELLTNDEEYEDDDYY